MTNQWPRNDRSSVSNPGPIYDSVPMIHVADVERSIAFYALLDFQITC